TAGEKRAAALARRARKALDDQQVLAARHREQRDEVRRRLGQVEELLASLSTGQLAALAELERTRTAERQEEFPASGALGPPAPRPGRASGPCGTPSSRSASPTSGARRARRPTTARG